MARRINTFEYGTFDSNGNKIDESALTFVGTIPISRGAGVWNKLIDMLNIKRVGGSSMYTCYRQRKDCYEVYVENGCFD
jgi:hypothetical protein